MKIIRSQVAMHHNKKRVVLIFDYDPLLVGKIKELPDRRWSILIFGNRQTYTPKSAAYIYHDAKSKGNICLLLDIH